MAAKRNGYAIILDYWRVDVEEDSWEEGLIGGDSDGTIFLETDTQVFDSFKALRDHMAKMYPALRKPSAFFTIDKGRLDASWASDAEGEEPTKREMAAFEKGKINLYLATMIAGIRIAKGLHEPTMAEIARVLKVRREG